MVYFKNLEINKKNRDKNSECRDAINRVSVAPICGRDAINRVSTNVQNKHSGRRDAINRVST